MSTSLPHFILIEPRPNPLKDSTLDVPAPLCESWRNAVSSILSDAGQAHFTILEGKLGELEPELIKCDCMVSPANSFGIMDGGYDLVLSRALKGEGSTIDGIIHHVQSFLQKRWRGYAPPGTATILPLPSPSLNPWGARTLAVVPTMRIPEEVSWNKDLVYNCMWALLVEIEHWNESAKEEDRIKRVLMTGLGTGQGYIGRERCARQMIIAFKHFEEGFKEKPLWADVMGKAEEVQATYGLD